MSTMVVTVKDTLSRGFAHIFRFHLANCEIPIDGVRKLLSLGLADTGCPCLVAKKREGSEKSVAGTQNLAFNQRLSSRSTTATLASKSCLPTTLDQTIWRAMAAAAQTAAAAEAAAPSLDLYRVVGRCRL